MNKSVLIVDDDDARTDQVTTELNGESWEIQRFKDTNGALHQIREKWPAMLVLSGDSGAIDSFRLLAEIRKNMRQTGVVFLFSTENFSQMRKAFETGANAVLLTPDELGNITSVCEKIFNNIMAEVTSKELTDKNESILKEQFESRYWKEALKQTSKLKDSVNIVRRIRSNFSQAEGIGTLISYLEFIKSRKLEEQDGHYLVKKKLMDQLFAEADSSRKILNSLNLFIDLIGKGISPRSQKLSSFFELLSDNVQSLTFQAKRHNNKIVIGKSQFFHSRSTIQLDYEALGVVIFELLVNALKFSKPHDTIFLIPTLHENKFGFTVVNPAYVFKDDLVGLPGEYQSRVFDPFFRMVEYTDEDYFEDEITSGLGLGLTLVRGIVELHGGNIYAHNIIDHSNTEQEPQTRVMFHVEIPFPD